MRTTHLRNTVYKLQKTWDKEKIHIKIVILLNGEFRKTQIEGVIFPELINYLL